MRRKHMPGCYCCQGCYIIPDEELPTITVPGYTFTSWGTIGGDEIVGGLCCRCAFFTPNDTEFTEVCSDYFAETTLEQVTSWVIKATEAPLPRVACFGSGATETTADHVCYGDDVEVATHTVEDTQSKKWKLFTRSRPGLLRVCISKQLVTCDEDEPVEKWVVLSVFQYELFGYIRSEISRSISSESELLHPCFQLAPGAGESCDDSCSQQVGDACDDPWDDIPIASTLVEFFRVKLFDELPDGEVTFDDTAKPQNCDWEFCEDPSEFLDQFCVSISSWPAAAYNCQCEETLIDPLYCEVTYDKLRNGCDCPNFIVIPGYFWEVLFPGSDPCARSLECVQPCEYFDCGTYTRTELCSLGGLPGGAIVPPTSEPCSGRWVTDVFAWDARNLCQDYDGPLFRSIGSTICWQHAPCSSEDCAPECCYSIECGDCVECLGPKFVAAFEEITAFSRTWTCELTPTSFCLNAPTWTATFS